jgi:hypothetical protein
MLGGAGWVGYGGRGAMRKGACTVCGMGDGVDQCPLTPSRRSPASLGASLREGRRLASQSVEGKVTSVSSESGSDRVGARLSAVRVGTQLASESGSGSVGRGHGALAGLKVGGWSIGNVQGEQEGLGEGKGIGEPPSGN